MALVRGIEAGAVAGELCERGLLRRGQPLVGVAGSAIKRELRRLQLQLTLGELPLQTLEAAERFGTPCSSSTTASPSRIADVTGSSAIAAAIVGNLAVQSRPRLVRSTTLPLPRCATRRGSNAA